jgi:tetratricopeptide (TPR) repeat protein
VLALQSEVALAIAKQIQVALTPSEHARLTTTGQVNPEAHEAYLLGRYAWNRSSREDKSKGVDYFKRAIAIDSTYALAYAGLADAYYSISNWWIPPDEAMPLARAAAEKAQALDPNLADAHGVLGLVYAGYDWDFRRAEAEFRRGIATGSSSATAHIWYGWYLGQRGRFDEARVQFAQAHALDPLSSYANWLETWPDFYQRRFDQTAASLLDLIALHPDYADAYSLLGETREQQGDLVQALVQLRKAESLGTHAWTLAAIGRVQAEAGHRDSALAVISELARRPKSEFVSPYCVASIYAALGDANHAFQWLERAVHERSEDLLLLGVDPRMDRLRSDPRCTALLRRVGLTIS